MAMTDSWSWYFFDLLPLNQLILGYRQITVCCHRVHRAHQLMKFTEDLEVFLKFWAWHAHTHSIRLYTNIVKFFRFFRKFIIKSFRQIDIIAIFSCFGMFVFIFAFILFQRLKKNPIGCMLIKKHLSPVTNFSRLPINVLLWFFSCLFFSSNFSFDFVRFEFITYQL